MAKRDHNLSNGRPLGLRITDQESARVVAIHRSEGAIVGSGCLVDTENILTCRHVIAAALDHPIDPVNQEVLVTLVGVQGQPTVRTHVAKIGDGRLMNDIAHLKIAKDMSHRLKISTVQFASPFRHGGKFYSVLGFPGGDMQGRNASGRLHAADAAGLVQMDGSSSLFVRGGFSGAPVWCSDVNAFVGMVVTEQANFGVSWCIPSRILCTFFPELPVRFRMPLSDRPEIHDYSTDDPNISLFGEINDNGQQRLKAKITKLDNCFNVQIEYKCRKGVGTKGQWITFITYPDFKQDGEDAYELFAELKKGKAEEEIWPVDLFTIAAIGNAGETALTLNLEHEWHRQCEQ